MAMTEPENLGGSPISPNGAKYRGRIKKMVKVMSSINDIAGHMVVGPIGSAIILSASRATKVMPNPIPPVGPPKKRWAINPEGRAMAIRPPEVEAMPNIETASTGSA